MSSGVTGFLASGTDDQLHNYHLRVCYLLNAIERRGQTVCYTCMVEDRERAISMARAAKITLQERGDESWNTVVQGEHRGWTPDADADRRCRVCGCTDEDCSGCIERTGEPCYWVEEDLCSACVNTSPRGAGQDTDRETTDGDCM